MGIIKKIVFIFFVLFTVQTSAQTKQDTIVLKGKMYVYHTVKPNETYQTIASKYYVNSNELRKSNKNVKLYFNQQLLIPIKSTFAERLLFKNRQAKEETHLKIRKNKDTLNIAILLPFYTEKNDSLLSFLSESQQTKEAIYSKSEMALNFLEGVIIATDSLKRAGMNINLFVYDTENDTAKVKQIITEGKLKDVDLIIGPAYQKNLSIVTKMYGKNKDKTIVSPLSKNSNILKHGSNIFQVIPPIKMQVEKVSDFVLKKHKKERILILAKKQEKKYANNYKSIFRENKIKSKVFLFNNLSSIQRDTICDLLSNHKYMLLVPSTDRAFVSKLIPVLGTIDTAMTVFGLNNWESFENLDIETLMKLNVHFPNPYFFDYESKENQRFVHLFSQKFHALPNRYAQIAFTECMYFCTEKGEYSFKQYYSRGGGANSKFPIVKYQDFSIIKVD